MTTARLRTTTQEVWQYAIRGILTPQWVIDCTEWHDDGLYLVRRSGKQRVDPLDWLIRDLDGDPLWMTNDDFQREYELT